MLIDLLQPMTPDLARRWLAALLLVDAQDREALVEAIERRVAEQYGGAARPPRDPAAREVNVVHPPTQREGYVEQVIKTYEVREGARDAGEESHPKRERKRKAK